MGLSIVSKIADEVAAERFLEMDRAGMSAAAIGAVFGVSGRQVVRWRRRLAVSHAGQAVPRPPEDHELARRLLDDGCSKAEAARSLGVTEATIDRWFPDVPGWTRQQAGVHSQEVRRLSKVA